MTARMRSTLPARGRDWSRPDAFGALSYSFVLETRGEAALSFAPSVDDGQPLTDYTFSLALLRLR